MSQAATAAPNGKTPPPLPQAQIDLADRKRLFPELQPEFVSADMLEKARRKEAKGDDDLPVAKSYVHSAYWKRKAEEAGIPAEEAEEMPLSELQEAIKTEMLGQRQEALRQPREIAPAAPPAPVAPPPAEPATGAALLEGIDMGEVQDDLAAVMKRMAAKLDELDRSNKAKDEEIAVLKQGNQQTQAERSRAWFMNGCSQFKALLDDKGHLNMDRVQVMNDLIVQIHSRQQQGKSLDEDLAKLCKKIYGDDSRVGDKPKENKPAPTALARPTHRVGAEELTGRELAERETAEYLEEVKAQEEAESKPKVRRKL